MTPQRRTLQVLLQGAFTPSVHAHVGRSQAHVGGLIFSLRCKPAANAGVRRFVFHFLGLRMRHDERHRTERIGWLRAAVLGANDGIVSTASLILGVAAAGADSKAVLVAGVAGLVAGAMSMAAGEYVSVSSQSDTERADLARERGELASAPAQEQAELAEIYVRRGLDPELASTVAIQLMKHDAIGAHARDELGISEVSTARPIQAAFASAGTFSVGASLPLLVVLLLPASSLMWTVPGSSLLFLALLGSLAAKTGGAPALVAAWRVTFWGALAMALTAGVGALFGVAI